MSNKPQLGKNIWNDEIENGREATRTLKDILKRFRADPGPMTRAQLIANAALAIADLEAVFSELDKIGREAKSSSKSTKQDSTLTT